MFFISRRVSRSYERNDSWARAGGWALSKNRFFVRHDDVFYRRPFAAWTLVRGGVFISIFFCADCYYYCFQSERSHGDGDTVGACGKRDSREFDWRVESRPIYNNIIRIVVTVYTYTPMQNISMRVLLNQGSGGNGGGSGFLSKKQHVRAIIIINKTGMWVDRLHSGIGSVGTPWRVSVSTMVPDRSDAGSRLVYGSRRWRNSHFFSGGHRALLRYNIITTVVIIIIVIIVIVIIISIIVIVVLYNYRLHPTDAWGPVGVVDDHYRLPSHPDARVYTNHLSRLIRCYYYYYYFDRFIIIIRWLLEYVKIWFAISIKIVEIF